MTSQIKGKEKMKIRIKPKVTPIFHRNSIEFVFDNKHSFENIVVEKGSKHMTMTNINFQYSRCLCMKCGALLMEFDTNKESNDK
jgi:hypothetical protein